MLLKTEPMKCALTAQVIGVKTELGRDGALEEIVSLRFGCIDDPVVTFHVERDVAEVFRKQLGRSVSLPIERHLQPIEMFVPIAA